MEDDFISGDMFLDLDLDCFVNVDDQEQQPTATLHENQDNQQTICANDHESDPSFASNAAVAAEGSDFAKDAAKVPSFASNNAAEGPCSFASNAAAQGPSFASHAAMVIPSFASNIAAEQAPSFANHAAGSSSFASNISAEGPSFANNAIAEGSQDNENREWQRAKWTDTMVKLLISALSYVREDEEALYGGGLRRKPAKPLKKGKWRAISVVMAERGHLTSPQQCEDKFNELKRKFKRLNELLGLEACDHVVNNPSLLDAMGHVQEKTKEEVRKILSSKHLNYVEMRCYYNKNRQYLDPDPAMKQSLRLMLVSKDDLEINNTENHDDQDHASLGNNALPNSVNMHIAQEPQPRNVFEEINQVEPENVDEWINERSLQLKEKKLELYEKKFELERKQQRWQNFCKRKEKEMDILRRENERMRLENDQMKIDLKRKMVEMEKNKKAN